MSGQNIEIVKLQVRRGPEAQLPILDSGEPAITTDTNKFFIGDGTNNHQLANLDDLANVNSQLAQKATQSQLDSVNVKYPPSGYTAAKGDGTTDDTSAIQALINDFPKVYIPNGTYIVSKLVLKTYRSIIGQSSHDTIIKAKTSTEPSLFVLDVGPVQHVRMENLWFQGIGTTNANQNGLYFKAQASTGSPYNGGLWLSLFKNIIIRGFDGVGLSLLGGSNGLLPNQALTFERVEVSSNSANNVNSLALLIEAQSEQISWNECAFSGNGQTSGTVAVFRRERDSGGNVVGDNGGNGQTFLQCYFGNSAKGITFERSTNIKLYGCYFEKLSNVIDINTTSEFITIEKSEFRDCGINSGNGYLVNGIDGASKYRFIANNIVSVPDKMIKGWGTKLVQDNMATGYNTIGTDNMVGDANIDASNTVLIPSKGVRINNTAALKTINSYFHGTNEVFIISWVAGGFTITTGGNINVGKTVTINQNDIVYLVKIEGLWWITSIVRATDYKV